MDQVRETMNIGNVARGSVPEVFEHSVEQVIKNIRDVNTSPTQKRKITLEFIFAPSETRETGDIEFKSTVKLAAIKAATGNFFIAATGAGSRAYCRDPRQDSLFIEQPPATPKAQ